MKIRPRPQRQDLPAPRLRDARISRRRAGDEFVKLEIERVSVARESDEVSRERLARLDSELAELREKSSQLQSQWQAEKAAIMTIGKIKEEGEAARAAMADAERPRRSAEAAELRYGTLMTIDKRLEAENARACASCRRAAGCSRKRSTRRTWPRRWPSGTGIPVTRLLEAEVQKLVKDGGSGLGRSGWSASERRSWRCRTRCAGPAPASPTPNRPSAPSCSWARRVGKTELARALAEFLFDDERAMIPSTCPSTWRSTRWPASSGRPPATWATTRAASSPRRCAGGRTRSCSRRDREGHADVFNVLLQLLDDGRLTDGQAARWTSATRWSSLTANLGSHFSARRRTGAGARLITDLLKQACARSS